MTNELKPCPFCGSDRVTGMTSNDESRLFREWVCCEDCGSSTTIYETKRKAAEAWNNRYKRTCRNVYKDNRHVRLQCRNGFECSECGNVIEDYDDHWAVKGTFNFCSKCGAEVIQ